MIGTPCYALPSGLFHFLDDAELVPDVPAWRSVALQAGLDLDDGLAEARDLDGAA